MLWHKLSLLILVVLLVGCGGGDDGGDDSGGGSPPPPSTGSIAGRITVPGTSAGSAFTALSGDATKATPVPQPLEEKAHASPPLVAAKGALLPIPRAFAQDAATAQAEPNVPELHVTFVWRDGTSDERKAAILKDHLLLPKGASFGRLLSYKILTMDDESTVHARLSTIPELTMLSVVKPTQLQFTPGDAYYPYQWDMKQMGMEQAWNITRGSTSIRVAVIDSGVQLNHEELAGRLVDGYDFISDPAVAGDGDGRDADPSDDTVAAIGGTSHGTHVAGTIGANAGTGGSLGGSVVGVDHFCKIMPIRCLTNLSGGTFLDIWDGLIYAADLTDSDLSGYSWFPVLFPTGSGLDPGRPRPSQRAHVINMSIESKLPLPSASTPLQIYNDLLAAAKAKGCTIVVAAGNDNAPITTSTTAVMPAASPSVICVGATDGSLNRAPYSNYGSNLSVMAPGGNIDPAFRFDLDHPESGGVLSLNSSTTNYEVVWLQGTSMAAPHIAGVCSLMKAVNPGLTPDQIKAILQSTAFDLGTTGRDDVYGYGFVLADRAIAAAASVTPATQLVAYTGGLTFDGSQATRSFTIGNAGGTIAALGSLSYGVTYGPGASGWITGSTIDTVDANYSQIGLTISTSGLPDGTYTATFTLNSSNGGSVAIPVTLQVLNTPPPPSFTTVYVRLINADTDVVVDQRVVTLPSRSYSFTGIAPGRYYVVAGTDLNTDLIIDGPNEYFGMYHNAVDSPIFTVQAGVSRLGFNITLTQQGNPG